MKIRKLFYGWIVLAACVFVTGAGIGLFANTSSIFIKPVCAELGVLRAQFSLCLTIITVSGALLMPVYAKLVKKFGTRKIMFISTVGLCASFLGFSFSKNLVQLYAFSMLNGLFFDGVNFMVVGILISEWFSDKKGLATGIAYGGSGLGGAISVPVFGGIIESLGWRAAYRGVAIAGAAILIPIIIFIIRDKPSDIGLVPYRSKKASDKEPRSAAPLNGGVTFRRALKTPMFWLLAFGLLLTALSVSGANVHTVSYLTDLGYTSAFAASVFTAFTLTLMAGKVCLGSFYDRFGALAGNIFIGVCCAIFPLLALAAHVSGLPWLYAFTLGLASCGYSVPLTVLVTKYFGLLDFQMIFSVLSMVTAFGGALSIPMIGRIFDSTGSYRSAWILLTVIGAAVLILLVACETTYRRRLAQKPLNSAAVPTAANN